MVRNTESVLWSGKDLLFRIALLQADFHQPVALSTDKLIQVEISLDFHPAPPTIDFCNQKRFSI